MYHMVRRITDSRYHSAMEPPASQRQPAIDRSRSAVLDAVVEILVATPDASMAEISARVGVGRTTLYRMFPTKERLVVAVALDAIDRMSRSQVEAGIPGSFAHGASVHDSIAAFERLIASLVPLGPRVTYLLRVPSLDDDEQIADTVRELDAVVVQAIQRGQGAGHFSTVLPASWILESLYAIVYVAWERVHRGVLAPADAMELVVETWLRGTAQR